MKTVCIIFKTSTDSLKKSFHCVAESVLGARVLCDQLNEKHQKYDAEVRFIFTEVNVHETDVIVSGQAFAS